MPENEPELKNNEQKSKLLYDETQRWRKVMSMDGNPNASVKEYREGDYKLGEWTIGCGQEARNAARSSGTQGVAVAYCTIGSPGAMSKGTFVGWYRCPHCHNDTDFSATFSFVGANPQQNLTCAQCGRMNAIGCRVNKGTNPVSGRPLLDVFVSVGPESGPSTENAIYIANIETDLRAKTIEAAGDISKVIADLETNNWPDAIKTLERIGEPVVLPLIAVVNDDTADVKKRGLAAAALGKIGDARGIEALVAVLKNQKLRANKHAVRNAIFALETAHDSRIAEALEPYRDDADQDIRKAADFVAEKHGIRRRQTAQTATPSVPVQQPSNKAAPNQQPQKAGCFIATACYGDYNHPAVQEFRWFRDHRLCNSRGGRFFTGMYYRFSPPLAELLKTQPRTASGIRRFVLAPLLSVVRRTRAERKS